MKHHCITKYLRIYISLCLLVPLFASCGQQRKAQSLVSDFMDTNIVSSGNLEIIEYAKLDSTKLITDSVVVAMRNNVKLSKLYKPNIVYVNERVGRKLYRLRVNYKVDGVESSATFYLDEGLNGVIAVKND